MKYIRPFWDEEYKTLEYRKEIFNDVYFIKEWRKKGYMNDITSFSGKMAAHNDRLPTWHNKIIEWVDKEFQLKDVGCCYYRMETNDIIPEHSDAYNVYTKKFNCKSDDVHKILVFLEDWRSGHYFEYDGKPFVNWKAGNWVMWVGNTRHFAANIGAEPRYTLQITGHK
tara:strand:+ start:94 stop:597 length:504 start_codon:yes stop_codon:yes gene_type:complete